MTEAEVCAEQIHKALPKVKAGTLRIWGEWFGSKPYDNWHTIKTCDAYGDRLRLDFDQSEKLLVWSPTGLTADESTFCITGARRVRWEWYYYGRPMDPLRLCFEDFLSSEEGITVVTSTNYKNYNPKRSEAAVEIL
jgi:hypothetical protein